MPWFSRESERAEQQPEKKQAIDPALRTKCARMLKVGVPSPCVRVCMRDAGVPEARLDACLDELMQERAAARHNAYRQDEDVVVQEQQKPKPEPEREEAEKRSEDVAAAPPEEESRSQPMGAVGRVLAFMRRVLVGKSAA